MTTEETSVEPQVVGDALDQIQSAATALGVPAETTETAIAVFRRHRDQRAAHAHNVATTAAACLYVACKVERVPRTVDEFVDATGVDRTQLLRRAKAVTSELGIDLSGFADASQYVDRYADELALPEDVADRAREIVDHCEDAGIAGGKSPSGWAAAAIYNASVEADMNVRQDTLTELADVTHVTIRNRYKEQREVLRERNPPPATAVAAIDWYREYLPASDYVASTARDLLESAADVRSVDDEPALRGRPPRSGSRASERALQSA